MILGLSIVTHLYYSYRIIEISCAYSDQSKAIQLQ